MAAVPLSVADALPPGKLSEEEPVRLGGETLFSGQ
jgi:hypothetical protein